MIHLSPKTEEAAKLFEQGAIALQRAEQQGIRVDLKYIDKQDKLLEKEIAKLEKEFKDSSFFRQWQYSSKNPVNMYSGQQLGIFLYKVKKIPVPKATAGGEGGSTDEETLKSLNIPELDTLLKIKKLKVLKDKYLKSLSREQVDGYIHPFFNLNLVRTYRSSSDRPNFQNFPKRDEDAMKIIRGAMFPRPEHQFLELDYKSLEVMIACCYHQDPTMMKYLSDKTTDMHRDMAQQIFKIKEFSKDDHSHKYLRSATKNAFVFPQFYGDYYANNAIGLACTWGKLPKEGIWKPGQGCEFENTHLADHLIKNGYKDVASYSKYIQEIERDFWTRRFPVYAKWKEKWWAEYQEKGYMWSKTGFTYQGYMTKNDCINYPVQGAAFHVLLWSFIEATKAMLRDKWKTKLVGQIHDAIVLDVYPPELDKIIKIMRCIMINDVKHHWPWINVPLEVEASVAPINGSWAETEEMKI